MDRASILSDAIAYLKELHEKIQGLENEIGSSPLNSPSTVPGLSSQANDFKLTTIRRNTSVDNFNTKQSLVCDIFTNEFPC